MDDNMDHEINEKFVEKVIPQDDVCSAQNSFVHIVIESEVGETTVSGASGSGSNVGGKVEGNTSPDIFAGRVFSPLLRNSVCFDSGESDDYEGISRSTSLDETSTIHGDVSGGESPPSSPLPATPAPSPSLSSSTLPWGRNKDKLAFPAGIHIDPEVRPGEFVMRTLFAEFTVLVEKKLDLVMAELLERPLSKYLQRGEDPVFDQLLSAFGSVAEHCLPSLLRTLYAWYERQGLDAAAEQRLRTDNKSKGEQVERSEKDNLQERRDLAVEFIFCLVLIEVLKQLPVHPGHEGLIGHIENLAFKHIKYREGTQLGVNSANIHIISDLYAEVIGVLAQSRFQSVRKRFTTELKELRSKEASPVTTQGIISLLMGMKFFRIKMVPIEEFEASFQFMQECAQYFLEVKDKDIKHALAGLFVETLVPVAASVKNEVNVPVLKCFVEMLYPQTLDMATKKKHSLALFPLVTCLLCVSHKQFFLQNWHYFLAMCLSHLKNKDPKMSRVALESLYRLLWVYMIRIKCESNTATQSRLHSIVNSLFPKGSKAVVPRDTPLNIFVKIIQFVSQERLDFAMKEIVFDLLSVGRPIKIILTPERMSIGLRAFLVVADSLQQKEGDPPMPRTVGVLPSGNTLRVKKTFLNKMLTEDTAKTIGISSYYPYVRKAFDDILRALDVQFGRPLMMTNVQNVNKEPDEMITGERKPKIDLFRTCVAAIPRLMPDGMSRLDLIEMLARLTVHLDEELKGLAFQSLQNLIVDFPEYRDDIINGFVQLLLKEVNDTFPQLLDNGLRMLLQLLTTWKNALTSHGTAGRKDSLGNGGGAPHHHHHHQGAHAAVQPPNQPPPEPSVAVLRFCEGFALVMLCNCRLAPRRLAVYVLKEVKALLRWTAPGKGKEGHQTMEVATVDVIDRLSGPVVERYLALLPPTEKTAVTSAANLDLQWLSERSSSVWTSSFHDSPSTASSGGGGAGGDGAVNRPAHHNYGAVDAWYLCLAGFLERDHLVGQCPTAVALAWPIVFTRLNALFSVVDPNPINDNRASLLRSATATKKPPNERDIYLGLWRNYTMFACRVVPANSHLVMRCASPDLSLSSSPDSFASDKSEGRSPNSATVSTTAFYKLVVPLLRCESSDIRDSVVLALGRINHEAIRDVMEELVVYIKEAIDKKQENMRRRRRRDTLRAQLARVFELIAEQGTFGSSPSVLERDSQSLHPTFVEYIDGARQFLEKDDQDKDVPVQQEIKAHFCGFICKLVKSFPLENRSNLLSRDLRRNLFSLFGGWSGKFGVSPVLATGTTTSDRCRITSVCEETCGEAEMLSLEAASAILCCGPMFEAAGLVYEDGYVFPWLEMLLSCRDTRVRQLAQETLVLLLEFNPDISSLLDWVVDCCYTGDTEVSDACFSALATVFSAREYPCDHYTAIINVTLMNTGCPRAAVQETALQLLQVLDKRFFGCAVAVVDAEPAEGDEQRQQARCRTRDGGADSLLSATYSRSQIYLSKQLSHLHPELTMAMFSEITHRFQTARPPVRQLLLRYLLPWLRNMELVDPHVPPNNPLSQFLTRMQEFYPNEGPKPSPRKEGWGSAEATEMVLNNLFYVTAKFGDHHAKEIEELWTCLCACWPGNLRVILRYLFIVSGMSPAHLLPSAKRVVLFMGRSRPERLVDELMNELQTVETMNCVIERTETPPFFRVTSVRKTSSQDTASMHADVTSRSELPVEEGGTIHTKRHSAEDPSSKDCLGKSSASSHGSLRSTCSLSSGGSCSKLTVAALLAEGGGVSPITVKDVTSASSCSATTGVDDNFVLLRRQGEEKADTPLPHPLPMPEYGGYFAPLTEFLPDSSQPISGFHRCNLAVMLLTDVVVDGLDVDWSVHVPLMLHIIFLGLDHSRILVYEHCKKLLLHLLIIMTEHNADDHLTVARVMLNNKTKQLGYGIVPPPMPILAGNFTDPGFDVEALAQQGVDPCGRLCVSIVTAAPAGGGNVAAAAVSPRETAVVTSNRPIPGRSISEGGSSASDVSTAAIAADLDTDSGAVSDGGSCSVSVGAAYCKQTGGGITITLDSLGPTIGGGVGSVAADYQGLLPVVSTAELVQALVDFVASRQSLPLWSYEDVTSRVWSLRSAEQLATFLHYVLAVFKDSLPQARIEERWAQIALQLSLSCSSRHLAGRSLQIFRALGVPVTPRMLSEILSRLVETVAEQGEDMQGYVTEIMLTLEAAVDSLDSDFHPIDFVKELFKSTPNLNKGDNRKSAPTLPASHSYHGQAPQQPGHTRSTSYSVTFCARKTTGSPTAEIKGSSGGGGGSGGSAGISTEMRNRSSTDVDAARKSTNLSRSRSAQSLKQMADHSTLDDKMSVLSQLFWIAVSLLESDYEYEFLLAMRLLEKVFKRLPLDRPDCREKVDKLHVQLKWINFPGVHSLLLKGLTSPATYEPTVHLLSKLTLLLDVHVVDPSQSIGFPFNVIALLPYMLQNYEETTRNPVCAQSAENIAQVCLEKSKKLENLATVMTLYSRRTFSKESFQWTKCVIKYLFDSYAHHGLAMMAFLVEVLEKGPANAQAAILSIVHCMLHYLDLNVAAAHPINADLLRVIAKYVEGPHWKEALKILKLAVTRSSTLVVPPSSSSGSCTSASAGFPSHYTDTTSLGSHTSFAEAEVFSKKELPGRTMEFSFDLSQTPIIGRRYQKDDQLKCIKEESHGTDRTTTVTPSATGAATGAKHGASTGLGGGGSLLAGDVSASPQRSVSLTQSTVVDASATVSGWKRPWSSQARTRECLVNLLTSCGQRVGLPKSPSDTVINKVIFSQSSDIVERQSSKCSSTEEVSVVNNDMSMDSKLDDATATTEQQFGVFKDFDFLEYELESQEGESMDNFNWGVRRRSLSNLDCPEPTSMPDSSLKGSAPNLVVRKEESSDDEMTSTSPVEDAGMGDVPSGMGLMFPNTSPLLDRGPHRSSPTSGSSHSICSDPDLGDLHASNASSLHFSSNIPSGTGGGMASGGSMSGAGGGNHTHGGVLSEAELSWRQHLHGLVSGESPSTSAGVGGSGGGGSATPVPRSCLLFSRAFKELRQRAASVTRDGCQCLGVLDAPRPLVAQFLAMVDALASVECPQVYMDAEAVAACRLVDKLKYCGIELQEHLDTFVEKRDHALECLEGIKTMLKIQSVNESMSEISTEDQQVELCRCLFKLHFQLLLLFDSFCKMIALLTSSIKHSQVTDMSSEVSAMRVELTRASEESEGDVLSSSSQETQSEGPEGGATRHDVEHVLLDLLHTKKWSKAVRLFQNSRNLFPTDWLTASDDDDVDIILGLYCKYLCEKKTGVLIITHMDQDLGEVFSHLMDVNVQLSATVRALDRSNKSNKERADIIIRKTEC